VTDQSEQQRRYPISSRIRHLPFDAQALEPIADNLETTVQTAPFRLPSGAVYQLLVPGGEERPTLMLTIWPSIRRVDAISTAATVVFTDVVSVDLVPDVEVQFRRSSGEYLIVAKNGKVIVRA